MIADRYTFPVRLEPDEASPPVLPVAWEQINDVWYSYVKGHNPANYFGIYNVVREDTFWLDKT